MATRTARENTEFVAKLIENIDIAMFTTVGEGGYLVSRPLSTQSAQFDGDRIWFFTEIDTPKVAELKRHPKVNIAYASKDKNTYVSVTGDARINRDRSRIEQFWNDAMKAFFPKGKSDPNLGLIEVTPRTAEYWDGPGSWFGKAVTFLVARVTGNDDAMGETRIVDMRTGRSRKPPSNDTSPRKGTNKTGKAPSARASGAKKSATKKTTTAKKAASKTTPAKKAASKKTTAKKAVTKKAAAKKANKAAKRGR